MKKSSLRFAMLGVVLGLATGGLAVASSYRVSPAKAASIDCPDCGPVPLCSPTDPNCAPSVR